MTTVFFDLETGGLEPHHPIIQLAAVATHRGKELGSLEVKIHFEESECDPEALKLNSYDPKLWANAETEAMAMQAMAGFCKEYRTVAKTSKKGYPYKVAEAAGHNIQSFDLPRLMAASKKHDVFMPLDWYCLDTYAAAIWYFKAHPPMPENLKLETLCKHFGIPIEAHDALGDVRANIPLARELFMFWRE